MGVDAGTGDNAGSGVEGLERNSHFGKIGSGTVGGCVGGVGYVTMEVEVLAGSSVVGVGLRLRPIPARNLRKCEVCSFFIVNLCLNMLI